VASADGRGGAELKAEHYGEGRKPTLPATVGVTALLPVIWSGLSLLAGIIVDTSTARMASIFALIISLGTTVLSAFWFASRRSANRWDRAGLAGGFAAVIGVLVAAISCAVWFMLSAEGHRAAYWPRAVPLYLGPVLTQVAIAGVIALVFQPESRSGI